MIEFPEGIRTLLIAIFIFEIIGIAAIILFLKTIYDAIDRLMQTQYKKGK